MCTKVSYNYPLAISVLLLSALFVSCSSEGRNSSQQPVGSYSVLTLSPRDAVLYAEYPATLQGHQTVEIRPRVNGYITKMYVDEGAAVKKGEKLFKLNSEEYEQQVRAAEADIKVKEAEVNTAEMNLKKTKPLADKDIVSQYEVESAQYNLQSKKAALAQAKAELINAKTNLGYTTVNSPADGVIGTIPYRVGSLVSSGIAKPLTTVADISTIYAYFSMSEQSLLEMIKDAKGADLRDKIAKMPPVDLILADNTPYEHSGHISIASGLINTATGSANFRATFPNPERILRSGGSGTIRIPTPKDSVIVIPKKATYDLQDKHFVYMVTDSGTVKSSAIQVFSLSTPKTYVVKNGLKSGDKIVLEGIGNLHDGTPIQPVPVDSDSLYKALNKD